MDERAGEVVIAHETSEAERVLAECKRRGVTLFLEDGKLAYKPQARMTKGLCYNIKQSKEQLLAVLGSENTDTDNTSEQASPDVPPEADGTGAEPASEVGSDLDEETYELAKTLELISALGLTLRCKVGNTENLWVTPREKVSEDLAHLIKKHKRRIILEMHAKRYRETGEIQCVNQVFELVRGKLGHARQ